MPYPPTDPLHSIQKKAKAMSEPLVKIAGVTKRYQRGK